DADGREYGLSPCGGRVAPSRSHRLVRVRDRQTCHPLCQGDHRQGFRSGEEDRRSRPVAAGQGRRGAGGHTERRPAVQVSEVRLIEPCGRTTIRLPSWTSYLFVTSGSKPRSGLTSLNAASREHCRSTSSLAVRPFAPARPMRWPIPSITLPSLIL